MEWQMYWRGWWRLYPWWKRYPRDEDGPAELWFGFGPFQARRYLWEEGGFLMSLDYINKQYKLSIKVGTRVRYTGAKPSREGVVTGADGAHVLIRLDGDKNSFPFHPTWELEYLT